MTQQKFKEQMARLNRKYPDVFDIEFQILIHKNLKDLPDENFEALIDYAIGENPNSNWPPKLSQFREYAESERSKIRRKQDEQVWRKITKLEPKKKGQKLDYMGCDNVLQLLSKKQRELKEGK